MINKLENVLGSNPTNFVHNEQGNIIINKINEIIDIVNNLQKIKPLLIIKLSTETREQFTEFYQNNFDTLVKSYPEYNVLLLYNGYSKTININADLKGIEIDKSDFKMIKNSVLESLEKFTEYLNNKEETINIKEKYQYIDIYEDKSRLHKDNEGKYYLDKKFKFYHKLYINRLLPTVIYNFLFKFYADKFEIINDTNIQSNYHIYAIESDYNHHIEFFINIEFPKLELENFINKLYDENFKFRNNKIIVNKAYYEKA